MPSRRQERINTLLLEELTMAVRTLKDPRIGMVTLTRVDVSPDLRHANVYFSSLEDDRDREEVKTALQHSAGFLHRHIMPRMSTKYVPAFHFHFDHSIATAVEMSQLINQARATDPNPGPSPDEDETPPDTHEEHDEE